MKKRGTPAPDVQRIAERLLRLARRVDIEDWTGKVPHGNVERDRYVQALRDAATIVRAWKP